ncbi:MAG: tetratricopeptide repeat protein [Planctomycetales bacterium]|nr:tetratricopeptide repeat protein [Planctomycetales bacterium]
MPLWLAWEEHGFRWLQLARISYDPAHVASARSALQRSLDTQPNFESLFGLAETANFSHHFTEALEWCRRAAEAAPKDTRVLAMRVEALLALGKFDQVEGLIARRDSDSADFYLSTSIAQWERSRGNLEMASKLFQEASILATNKSATELATWSLVMASGVWLDAGDLKRARPLLEKAAETAPDDLLVQVHLAELAELENRFDAALQIYTKLTQLRKDPELHRRIYVLATRQQDATTSAEHFKVAETLCRRATDAGESYALETLANLLCDAERYAEAIPLAVENLSHKQDTAAKETLARARHESGNN